MLHGACLTFSRKEPPWPPEALENFLRLCYLLSGKRSNLKKMVGRDITVKMGKVDIAEIINGCDEKRQQYGFEKLNDSERVVSLISYLYYEVELGGIDGFYYNSAGDYAVETVWALEQIGAIHAAKVVKRINALFPGGVPAKDLGTRQEDLERLSSQPDDPFEELEEEFLSDETSIWERLEKFIIMRLDELPTKDTKGRYR